MVNKMINPARKDLGLSFTGLQRVINLLLRFVFFIFSFEESPSTGS